MVDPNRQQMKIWSMLIAHYITKARNTHSEYVTLIAFPLKQWLHERASMLRYTHIARLVVLKSANIIRRWRFCRIFV